MSSAGTALSSPPPASPAAVATDRSMISAFLRSYAWRYRGQYALGMVFLLATNVLTVGIPWMQKHVFDELTGARRADRVHLYALAIAGAALLVIVVRTLSRVLFFNPGRTIEFRIRNDMLSRLLHMSPVFFRRWPIGDLMARASDDATYVRALVGFSAIMVLNIVLAAAMALAQMVQTDAWLTLYCVVPLVLAVMVLRTGVKWAMGMMRDTQKLLGKVSNVVLESYKGIAVVQGAAVESAFIGRFDEASEAFTDLNVRQAALRTFLMPVVGAVGNLCIFLLLYIGGRHVAEGSMSVGDLAAYASYLAVLVGSLASAGWVVGVLQRGSVSLRRVWDVLELQSDLPGRTVPLPMAERGVHLQIRDLTYAHPGGSEPILRDLAIDLQPGTILGISGPVGSGKSTLVALLSRLSPAPTGAILCDNIDLQQIADTDLRRDLAVVPQEALLFSRSIFENIGFFDRRDQIDRDRVAHAADSAQLTREIDRMPDGYETVVGEKGLTLSGGQRQRVQLARAFYRGFRLLILDDVLSAVDHDTEERLLGVLRAQIAERGTTAVIVSHRLSALARADHIVMLGDPSGPQRGRIVEQGRHAELVALGGVYAHLWAVQQQHDSSEQAAVVDPLAVA